jgi:hypothetical protein
MRIIGKKECVARGISDSTSLGQPDVAQEHVGEFRSVSPCTKKRGGERIPPKKRGK